MDYEKSGIVVFCILALSFQVAPVTGGVTSHRVPSIERLTKRADVIIIGKVLLTQSEWNTTRTAISTRIDLQVQEVFKGSVSGEQLSFYQLGGKVGEIASSISGVPSFERGETVLLFLSRRKDGTLGVVGLFHGRFLLEKEAASGGLMAIRREPDSGKILDRIPLEQARDQILKALELSK